MINRATLLGLDVIEMTNKPISLAIIPKNFRLRSGTPLQHTSLLPVPSLAFAKRNPSVTIFQVDHAYGDHIIAGR